MGSNEPQNVPVARAAAAPEAQAVAVPVQAQAVAVPPQQAAMQPPQALPGVPVKQPVHAQPVQQPLLTQPYTTGAATDPAPVMQFAFMWGWLAGLVGVPCVCCSTCVGCLLNKLLFSSFVKNRRDQEAAFFVEKGAKAGCNCCILISLIV